MPEYGVHALAEALVEARRRREAEPALRDYYASKLAALLKALDADETRQRRHAFGSLLDATVERLARSSSPFEGMLVAPKPIVDLYQRHGQAINTAAAGLQEALMALLVDLTVAEYEIPPDRIVSDEDLSRYGFDPRTPKPDLLDFW